jgi:hypothetical protein
MLVVLLLLPLLLLQQQLLLTVCVRFARMLLSRKQTLATLLRSLPHASILFIVVTESGSRPLLSRSAPTASGKTSMQLSYRWLWQM